MKEFEEQKRISNYHTHTTFCDGKDTPEEMVKEALRLGYIELGFSGHSYTFFDERYCMSQKGTEEYKQNIRNLQQKYAGELSILLGVEQDYFSEEPTDDYDYVIGSVHYVKKNGRYLPVDESREIQEEFVKKVYNGDFYAFAEDYYALIGDVYRRTKCDMIGHFDLVTKFNEDNVLFDTNHPRYIMAAKRALDRLLQTPVLFEINEGAVLKGYRSKPYLEQWMIEQIERAGKTLVRNADAHEKKHLQI